MIVDTLSLIHEAVMVGARIVMSQYQTNFSVSTKSNPQDFVTEVDIACQSAIAESITSQLVDRGVERSTIGFIGEESLFSAAEHLFVIDPIDGTSSFVMGNNQGAFCISVAYVHKGVVQAGVVYDPLHKVLFTAESGKGATKVEAGKTEQLTSMSSMQDTLSVAYTLGSDSETKLKTAALVEKCTKAGFSVERTRSCIVTLASVIAGNEYQVAVCGAAYVWDLAAVSLILFEAGAALRSWDGSAVQLQWENPNTAYAVVSGNQVDIERLVAL